MSSLPASDPSGPTPAKSRAPWIVGAVAAAAMVVGAGFGAMRWERLADLPAEDVLPLPPPASALVPTTLDLDLATSTQAEKEHGTQAVTVLVTRKQLLIGGDPTPIATFPEGLRALGAAGLPPGSKRNGRDDLFLPDLGNGLTFWHDAAKARAHAEPGELAVAVLADTSTPYRVLVEVLFTAGQSGFNRFEIAVRAADGSLRWIVSRPPQISTHDPRGARPLSLAVFVTDAGASIRARGENVAPGCDSAGPGVTIPKVAGTYDHPGLTACLRKIKDLVEGAKEETTVTLTADPAIELQTIASTMDTLKGTREAGPLFPTVYFGVARDGAAAIAAATSDRRSVPLDRSDLYRGATSAEPERPTRVKVVGNASVGSAAVSGGNLANAPAVVAGMAAGFRRCYNKGLQEDPMMKGSVRITAKIGPNGDVLAASPSGGDGLSGTVVSCIAARVSAAQFAPPSGGGATLIIPVTLTPQ